MGPYDFFQKGLECAPDEAAFVDTDGSHVTYAQAARQIERAATGLNSLPLKRLHVAVYSPNNAKAFIAILSIFVAGGRWVPVNARNSVETNADFLQKTDCEVLVFHSSLAAEVAQLRVLVPQLRTLICLDGSVDDVGSLDALSEVAARRPSPAASRQREDVSLMVATGGTTGASKAAIWTETTWECFAASFWIHMPVRKRPVYLVAAPMTHAAGILAFPLMLGGSTTVILDGVDPAAICQAIEEHGVTHLFLPPTAIYMLLDDAGVRDHDYASLEYFIYSASPMSATRLRQAWEVFGPVMTQGYGLAEAPLLCTFMSPREHLEAIETGQLERLESSGRPSKLMRVSTIDDQGHEVDPGELGEIAVRGGLVSPAYYNDAALTDASRADGWLRTGDVGRFDKDGFLYIVDRKKDMIISGGFNVYSSEVEQVVMDHEGVANCAVIGIPDERWGELVTAVVQPRPDTRLDAAEIIARCRKRLGGVKAPKKVIFRAALPVSPQGKVLKRLIREEFWTDATRKV